jgi:hypothetical protein
VTASGGAAASGEAAARVSAWRGETGYQARTSAHGGSTQSDGWSQSADAILYPARSSQGAWLARGAYREWTLNDVRALSSVTGTTGYRRAHTPLLRTEGEVGVVAERDADGNTQDPKPAWSFGIEGIARALGLPIESRLRAVHDLITGGEAELRRSVGGMGVSAGWKRSLEAEGGRFDVPVVKDYATVGLEDSLVADAVISVEGSYGRTRPREAGADQIEDYRAQGSVSRPFRPWLWGRATYSYLRQKDAAGSTSHRGRAEIVLTASLR